VAPRVPGPVDTAANRAALLTPPTVRRVTLPNRLAVAPEAGPRLAARDRLLTTLGPWTGPDPVRVEDPG
jgi:hypothetical protein